MSQQPFPTEIIQEDRATGAPPYSMSSPAGNWSESLGGSGNETDIDDFFKISPCEGRVPKKKKTYLLWSFAKPGGGGRGGRLTSLDASFARCFVFWRTSSKTSTSMFFQKNRQNIASLRKKHDVLHDVLCFRNFIQSYERKAGYLAKNVTLNSFYMTKTPYRCL